MHTLGAQHENRLMGVSSTALGNNVELAGTTLYARPVKHSGSAADRAADGPLQPIVRPPLLTHIAQVCSGWTINQLVNSKPRHRLA